MARVALIGENSVEYIDKLIDIWNNGDCAVLIDWRIPPASAIAMMEEADVNICFLQESLYDFYKQKCEHICFCTYVKCQKEIACLPKDIYDKFKENYTESEALVLFSSGTTGKSKGIILSHFAINTNADFIIEYMNLKENDRFYILKSFCHSSTIVGELIVGLKRKLDIYVSVGIFHVSKMVREIINTDSTIVCLNPTLLKMLCYTRESILKSRLRVIYISGEYISAEELRKCMEKLCFPNIFNVYGLTEAGPRVCAQRIEHNPFEIGSVGKPIGNIQIKIQNNGVVCRNNEIGQIMVKTDCLFLGYISNKEKRSKKAWFLTGDLGYISDNGNLFIKGRIDDVIIVESHNILPNEIEDKIMKACKKIEFCIVCLEENILICRYKTYSCCKLNRDEIRMMYNIIKQFLAPYEMPKKFIYDDKIVNFLSGKKRRKNV